MRIASIHISCVFRLSETSLIHARIISSRDVFIHTLKPRPEPNFMDRTQITSSWSFYRCEKTMKTYLNSRWKMMIQVLNPYLELHHLSMYKQWTCTKNGDLFWKNDERILSGGDVITKNLWKHTKIQLSNRGGRWVLDILTVYASFLKRPFIDVELSEFITTLKKTLNRH